MTKEHQFREPIMLYGSENEPLAQALELFTAAFNPKVDKVYYPGSNAHIVPSLVKGFAKSTVIYADTYAPAVNILKRAGYKAYRVDAEKFNPGKVDVLICEGIYWDKPLEAVVPGGYVIGTGTERAYWADYTGLTPDFDIVGLIRRNEDGQLFVDRDHPEEYLQEVESEEEWQKRDPHYYKVVQDNIEWNNIINEDFFDAHRKLAELSGKNDLLKKTPYGIPNKKDAEYVIYRKKQKS